VFLVSTSVSVLVQLCDLLGVSPSKSVSVCFLLLNTHLSAFRPFDYSIPQIPACLCSQQLFCLQCIWICLMGMLGGFYITLRASRHASTPAFDSYLAIDFSLPLLGNCCSQCKIHSRLCFGSMSCRGFQFFGFPCLRFSSSLLSQFFSQFSSQSCPPLYVGF